MSGSGQDSRLESFYWWLKEHWWASLLFITVPAIVITVVELLGGNLGLTTPSGKLNPTGIAIVLIALVAIVLFSAIKDRIDSKLLKSTFLGQEYLEIILKSVNNAQSRKKDRFVHYIEQNKDAGRQLPFKEITQPRIQLNELAIEIQDVFSKLFGISKNQIGISIIGKTNENRTWEVIAIVNVGAKEHILDLLKDQRSGFRLLLNTDKDVLFIPDKAKALLRGEYSAGSRDIKNEYVGSLICRRIRVAGETTAVLSISTYGKFLYPENNRKPAETKIENQILPAFLTRIELELALLYIKDELAA